MITPSSLTRPFVPSVIAGAARAARAILPALRRRALGLLGPAVLAGIGIALFLPLLAAPGKFPAAGDPEAAARGIVDAVTRAAVEGRTGEVPYLDPSGSGRNLAADGASFYTHPLYYGLSRALPPGLSLSLVGLAHALILGIGAYLLALRLGLARVPATFAGAAAVACGGALPGLAAPGGLATAGAAALVPAIALLADDLRRRPTLPRIGLAGIVVSGAAVGGSLSALAAASGIALLVAALLAHGSPEARRTAAGRPSPFPVPPGRGSARLRPGLALLIAFALGLSLGAYRALPRLLGDPAGAFGLGDATASPWWMGSRGGLRLPFFLGAAGLIALAAAGAGGGRRRWARPLAAASALVAAASPPFFFPFLGLPLALAGAAGIDRLGSLVPARIPVGTLLVLGLVLEAVPYHRDRLTARTPAEVAAAPGWVDFAARVARGERIAVLGPDDGALGPAFMLRGALRAQCPQAADLDGIAGTVALAVTGARVIVSDLPDSQKRYPLLRADRASGKWIYANPAHLGPAWWTQEVEPAAEPPPASQEALPKGVTGKLEAPTRLGAVRLLAAEASDPPGIAHGVIRSAIRTPGGVRVTAEPTGPAFLVLPEPYLDGLTARVDGRPAPLLRANGTQVAVPVPGGRHEVQLELEPPGLATGEAISALALGSLPFLFAAPLFSALAVRTRARVRRGDLPSGPASPAPRRRAAAPEVAEELHEREMEPAPQRELVREREREPEIARS